jgi:membrane-bound lytic murein transglycosylase B
MRYSRILMLLVPLLFSAAAPAHATTQGEAEAIYAEWLRHYADRQPELAIAQTSSDFVMVNNQAVMNRDQALAFVQAVAQFIVSRQCTNRVVTGKSLPQKAELLLSRVDCQFQTLAGPLEAHFLETIIVDKHGAIVYDHFSDVANPSLP